MADYLKIKNWERFQHYKDRSPPWIKLHYEILTSPDWVMVDDASKLLAIVCMMLASRNEGKILHDGKYIQKVANLSKEPCFKQLIASGFFESSEIMLADASKALADASTKKRREEERREEDNLPPPIPDWIPKEAWQDFMDMRRAIKKPMTAQAEKLIIRKLDGFRQRGFSISSILERSTMNNWQDVFEPKPESNQYGKPVKPQPPKKNVIVL